MSVPWGEAGCTLAAGRYRLVAPAGSGGMAVVWRAVDTVLGREVAIKMLRSHGCAEGEVGGRLKTEAQAIAKLKHRHITAIYDFGEELTADGAMHPFVVMELVTGRTVKELLDTGHSLGWRRATAVAAQVASALACAHESGIVHRDISCTNIILTDDGVKVLDFGIAAWQGEPDSCPGEQVLGTPAYIAPERLRTRDAPVTAAADVYALGLLWYQMMVSALPWQARTATGLLQAHLVYTPAPLPPIEGLPERLRELCMACLDKNPLGRPATHVLAAELARHAEEPAPVTLPLRTRPHRRKTLAAATATAAAVTVAVLAGSLMPDREGQSTQTVSAPKPAPSTGAPTAVASTGAPVSAAPAAAPVGGLQKAAAASPIPSPAGEQIRVAGGTVLVACVGERAHVVTVTVEPGYHIKDLKAGPADEVRIVLKSTAGESEIKVTCRGGVISPVIKDNLKPPPPSRDARG